VLYVVRIFACVSDLLKIIVIGPSGVGKSSLLLRYALGAFEEDTRTTIGVDFKHKSLRVNDELVNCQIWDTAGQERFSCISKEYYRGANGCLLVYDITDGSSFAQIDRWYQELLQYCHTTEPPITMLIGNKADLKHVAQVTTADAMAYSKQNNLGFFETSAKTNSNVETAFGTLVEDIVKELKKGGDKIGALGSSSNDSSPSLPKASTAIKLPSTETKDPTPVKKPEGGCCQ